MEVLSLIKANSIIPQCMVYMFLSILITACASKNLNEKEMFNLISLSIFTSALTPFRALRGLFCSV
jgi:hypothetical protein